jgi:hypothetical protein
MYGIYRIAIAYTLLKEIDSAFYYLNEYVDNSDDDRVLLADKKFNILREQSEKWGKLQIKIEQGFVHNVGIIKDTSLAVRLFYLGIEDQKYRLFYPVLNQYEIADRENDEKNDYDMQDSCIKIITQYGLPTISMVGGYASMQFFLLLQHSNSNVMGKYYKLVKKAWKRGDFNSMDYALLTDRVRTSNDKKQIYGTQIQRSSNDKKYPNQFYLLPVKNFKNVNKRREKMGFLETVEEYVLSFSDAFIPKEYYQGKGKGR